MKVIGRIKGFARKLYLYKKYMVVILAVAQTTVDTTSLTQTLNDLLPLIIAMISLAIPLIFIKYIMRFLEKILSGFG